jgi:hypothetical protein
LLQQLECGAAEERGRSVAPIMLEMKKCYKESKKRGITYIQYKDGRIMGLVISCVGTAL